MFDDFYTPAFRPVPYHCFNGLKDGEATRTGLFNLFAGHELTSLFSGYDFWSDLTATLLDAYLNTFLSTNIIVDSLGKYVHFDRSTKIWTIDNDAPLTEIASALAAKFTETEATYLVMTQQNLNIVEFTDIDRNVYGARNATRNYDKVVVDLTNGQRTLTDVIASRSDTIGGGTDTSTLAKQGFNSSTWQDADKTTNTDAARTNTRGGGTDTHTDAASTDKQETAAREDTEAFTSYTDTLNHTKHIVLSPDAYFEIQKEMADYNLYASVMDVVKSTICKGVW